MGPTPSDLDAAAQKRLAMHAPYLYSTATTSGLFCQECRSPVLHEGDRICHWCQIGKTKPPHGGTVDRTAWSIYAHLGKQSYTTMQHYKGEFADPEHQRVVFALVWEALRNHHLCAGKLAGTPVTHLGVVPSTRSNSPLASMAAYVATHCGMSLEGAALQCSQGEPMFATAADLSGAHVLILEDAWVRGTKTQHAAQACRDAGAAQVSVHALARYTRGYGPGAAITKHAPAYAAARCPWTPTGVCP